MKTKELIRKNKLVIFLVVVWFLWVYVRPAIIRNQCHGKLAGKIESKEIKNTEKANRAYAMCLAKWGMRTEDIFSK